MTELQARERYQLAAALLDDVRGLAISLREDARKSTTDDAIVLFDPTMVDSVCAALETLRLAHRGEMPERLIHPEWHQRWTRDLERAVGKLCRHLRYPPDTVGGGTDVLDLIHDVAAQIRRELGSWFDDDGSGVLVVEASLIDIEKTGENSAKIGRWFAIRPAGETRWMVRSNELDEWAPTGFDSLEAAADWVRNREAA